MSLSDLKKSDIDVIYLDCLDPFFNLACEEYLTKNTKSPIFMLWQNSPCVVLGRGQNAQNEINENFVRDNHITICRRISGGGAVFHDLGNVNFTFIFPENEKKIDFPKFVSPICDAISKLSDKKATLSGRNDIILDGQKVSGNAQCHLNGNVMHHGCILWDADLSKLAGALNPDPSKLSKKGIKSVKSRVGNIKDITESDMNENEFINFLFSNVVPDTEPRRLTTEEIKQTEMLKNEKFATSEWIWGKDSKAKYRFSNRFDYGKVEIAFNLENDRICDLSISGDFFGSRDSDELAKLLNGKKINELDAHFTNVGEYIHKAKPEDIKNLFCSALTADNFILR